MLVILPRHKRKTNHLLKSLWVNSVYQFRSNSGHLSLDTWPNACVLSRVILVAARGGHCCKPCCTDEGPEGQRCDVTSQMCMATSSQLYSYTSEGSDSKSNAPSCTQHLSRLKNFSFDHSPHPNSLLYMWTWPAPVLVGTYQKSQSLLSESCLVEERLLTRSHCNVSASGE